MSKRGTAVHRRVHPHLPVEGDPGCCTVCGLPTGVKNQLHLDELPAVDPDITAAEARRVGEKD